MPLPTGTISMSQVNVELGYAATTTISLNQADVRALAGVPSGTISMSNLQGKAVLPFTSIQRGTSYQGAAVGISAVDTSKSIVNPTGYDSFSGNNPSGGYAFASSTQITFPQDGATGKTFGWEVLEYNNLDIKSIQRGTSYQGAAVTISSVDTSKSIINPTGYDSFSGNNPSGGYAFASSTQITFPQDGATGKTFGWEVIEFF